LSQQAEVSRSLPSSAYWGLTFLRIVIGWHFLYEGLSKLFTPDWSAYNYLAMAKWFLAGVFHWVAATPTALAVVDFLNIWGLILIGIALLLGVFSRVAALCGVVLLGLYYTAHPALVGMDFGVPQEGSYLWVDKNIVELFALALFCLIPGRQLWGFERLLANLPPGQALSRIARLFSRPREGIRAASDSGVQEPAAATDVHQHRPDLPRRELLRNLVALPVLGGFVVALLRKLGWESYEERFLQSVDTITSATIRTFDFATLQQLEGPIPKAKIRNLDISRVIMGGNLIGGWAHARDLIYVSKLVKAYHSDEKVFETLLLAEKCGINALITNPLLCRVISEYWRRNIGNIHFISDCGGTNLLERVRFSIDNGASACYVQGEVADRLAREGDFDLIARALELTRQSGLPAGVGAHSLDTVIGCVEYGLEPDFWMKTLHHCDYWSAQKENQHDNIWCVNPEETIAYMEQLPQPWIAFKILAAGAIHPEVGLKYAFEKGADFACVGMYDFQIVENANLALNTLSQPLERTRPWRA
jgi:uncharacterized membrane protein YphA (DoxX/SURF4 family)